MSRYNRGYGSKTCPISNGYKSYKSCSVRCPAPSISIGERVAHVASNSFDFNIKINHQKLCGSSDCFASILFFTLRRTNFRARPKSASSPEHRNVDPRAWGPRNTAQPREHSFFDSYRELPPPRSTSPRREARNARASNRILVDFSRAPTPRLTREKRENARDRLTEAFSTDQAPFGATRAALDPRAARDAR